MKTITILYYAFMVYFLEAIGKPLNIKPLLRKAGAIEKHLYNSNLHLM